jgi:hypothetical protein
LTLLGKEMTSLSVVAIGFREACVADLFGEEDSRKVKGQGWRDNR